TAKKTNAVQNGISRLKPIGGILGMLLNVFRENFILPPQQERHPECGQTMPDEGKSKEKASR
ncbi:MAG TPA: hypothetical protein PK858_11135, partial [Saprospiraceae bacterium]|nr:hypothetical protein [Saprospiraceae bacterium]